MQNFSALTQKCHNESILSANECHGNTRISGISNLRAEIASLG